MRSVGQKRLSVNELRHGLSAEYGRGTMSLLNEWAKRQAKVDLLSTSDIAIFLDFRSWMNYRQGHHRRDVRSDASWSTYK